MSAAIGYYGGIVTDGLVLYLDAAKRDSYPGFGNSWRSIARGATVTGTLTNGPLYNTASGSMQFDGIDDYVQVSGTRTLNEGTFSVWIRRVGTQQIYAGVLFSRQSNPNVSGIGFYSSVARNNISYHWNADNFGWNSGLTAPDQAWCMAAVSISPSSATAYLCQQSGITSSSNAVSHASSTVLGNINIGRDSLGSRQFTGDLSIASIYNRALSATEILQNYNATKGRFGL